MTDSTGDAISAPGVCFMIPPPDAEAVALADQYVQLSHARSSCCHHSLSPPPPSIHIPLLRGALRGGGACPFLWEVRTGARGAGRHLARPPATRHQAAETPWLGFTPTSTARMGPGEQGAGSDPGPVLSRFAELLTAT